MLRKALGVQSSLILTIPWPRLSIRCSGARPRLFPGRAKRGVSQLTEHSGDLPGEDSDEVIVHRVRERTRIVYEDLPDSQIESARLLEGGKRRRPKSGSGPPHQCLRACRSLWPPGLRGGISSSAAGERYCCCGLYQRHRRRKLRPHARPRARDRLAAVSVFESVEPAEDQADADADAAQKGRAAYARAGARGLRAQQCAGRAAWRNRQPGQQVSADSFCRGLASAASRLPPTKPRPTPRRKCCAPST